jgi:hypothetical protein
MGGDNSTQKKQEEEQLTSNPTEQIIPVNKKIPKKKIVLRKIIKKDKVINFLNIPLFVSEKDPSIACEKLYNDLDLYEVGKYYLILRNN